MARRLGLFAAAATLLAVSAQVATGALCPRSLSSVLSSPSCSDHLSRLLATSATTTFQATGESDRCVDTLRALLATTPTVPCLVAHINSPRIQSSMRRLEDDFEGKLNCTLDASTPLNGSDPNRHVVLLDCKRVDKPKTSFADNTALQVIVGSLCGILCVVLYVLYITWQARRQERAARASANATQ